VIRLGTRGSALALAQARWVAERLPGEVELVPITTSGDESTRLKGSDPLSASDSRGLTQDKSRFVKEIEDALLREEVDLAVHSAKDVPAELPEGLAIVAVPERADPRDALCSRDGGTLESLGEGAAVGTASLRRRAQLLAERPDLRVLALRGNVDTRLRRLDEGELDALVLASAGLARLGVERGSPISEEQMTPAPGQGCLALEARSRDKRTCSVASRLTHEPSLAVLGAERALVTALGATCHTPVGAHARLQGSSLRLDAFAGLPDGSAWVRDSMEGHARAPAALGAAVGERLLSAGAGELLASAESWGE
jgi:hydroxymethylbilane synthase